MLRRLLPPAPLLLVALMLTSCSESPEAPGAGESAVRGRALLHGEVRHDGVLVLIEPVGSGAPARVVSAAATAGRGAREGGAAGIDAMHASALDSTWTAADGSYRFDHVPPGTYTVHGFKNGLANFVTPVVAVAGVAVTAPDMTLAATGGIGGQVELAGETDHSGAIVYVGGTGYAAFTDRDGNYLIADVPAGSRSLYAARSGFETVLRGNIVVQPGETATVSLITLHPLSGGAPRLTYTFPAAGDTVDVPAAPAVPPPGVPDLRDTDVAMVLQFSRAMDWASVVNALGTVPPLHLGVFPAASDQLVLVASTVASTWQTSIGNPADPLRLETGYEIVIGAGASDLHGLPMGAATAIGFRTGAFRVVAVREAAPDPQDLAYRSITFLTNGALPDLTSAMGSLVTVAPAAPSSWHLHNEGVNGFTAQVHTSGTSGGSLVANAEYAITVGTGLGDLTGHMLRAPFEYRFQTGPIRMFLEAPAGVADIKATDWIYLEFNTLMDAQSVYDAISIDPPVELYFNWYGPLQSIIQMRPLSGRWDMGTTYRIAVDAGAVDTYGVHFPGPDTVAFRVEPFLVRSVTPADGSAGVREDQELYINTNAEVDSASVAGAVRIHPETPLSYRLSSTSEGARRRVVLSHPVFAFETPYTVIVDTTLASIDGHRLAAPLTFRFTTDAERFTVAGTDPRQYQREVALDYPVTIRFTLPPDSAFLRQAIAFSPAVTWHLVSVEDTTAVLEPDIQWGASTSYAMTIDRTAHSTGGRQLTSSYTLRFRTTSGRP